jgi:hypothetical protein
MYPLVSIFFLFGFTSGIVQFFDYVELDPAFDYTCTGVLNQQVQCDAGLPWALDAGYLDTDTLTSMCTSSCAASLATWLRRANGACSTLHTESSGDQFLPSMYVETVVEKYNIMCLQNRYVMVTTGNLFCVSS